MSVSQYELVNKNEIHFYKGNYFNLLGILVYLNVEIHFDTPEYQIRITIYDSYYFRIQLKFKVL